MNRRQILKITGLGIALPLFPLAFLDAGARTTPESIKEMQRRWRDFHPVGFEPVRAEPSLDRPLEEWRRELPKEAYRVLFEEDTERSYSSALNDEKRPGLFVCQACNLPLFTSEMKYDSRTGWPSFFTTIPGHLATKTDFKLIWPRTEYHCVKCGGHQGHIFDDGPQPTGKRWCNNGLALRFIEMATETAG